MKKKFLSFFLVTMLTVLCGCGASSASSTMTIHNVKIDLKDFVTEIAESSVNEALPDLLAKFDGTAVRAVDNRRPLDCTNEDFDPEYNAIGFMAAHRPGFVSVDVLVDVNNPNMKVWTDTVAPNGTSLSDSLESLSKSSEWYQVISLRGHGDVYKANLSAYDFQKDFGKSYVAIYADGKAIDISKYEKKSDAVAQDTETADMNPAGASNLTNYGYLFRPITTPLTYANVVGYGRFASADEQETYQSNLSMYYRDLTYFYALCDMVDKLDDGEIKEIMVIRMENSTSPMLDAQFEDNSMYVSYVRYNMEEE